MKRELGLALGFLLLLLGAPVASAGDVPGNGRGHDGDGACARHRHARTPRQVFADHKAALSSGDLDRVMCNYADDAVVLSAGGVARGKEQIRAALQVLMGLLGGAEPTVVTLETAGDVLFITFTLDGPLVSIPDGADTYVIRHGLIRIQTAHDPLVFKAPPGATP